MNQTGPFQTKATMHRWRHLTGAEVAHSRRRDLFKRMLLWCHVGNDAVSSPDWLS
jgi:hypothetical protein